MPPGAAPGAPWARARRTERRHAKVLGFGSQRTKGHRLCVRVTHFCVVCARALVTCVTLAHEAGAGVGTCKRLSVQEGRTVCIELSTVREGGVEHKRCLAACVVPAVSVTVRQNPAKGHQRARRDADDGVVLPVWQRLRLRSHISDEARQVSAFVSGADGPTGVTGMGKAPLATCPGGERGGEG